MTKIYTVNLIDTACYRIDVAADSENEAQLIAKETLHEEASTLPSGLSITDRDTRAEAKLAEIQPLKMFLVSATYSLDFELTVPARTAEDAEAYAKRLYRANAGPFEFSHCGDRVSRFVAEEVRS